MKNLKISHTIYPSGNRRDYTGGKPLIERRVNDIGFNLWSLNTMRSVEGICYEKALDEVLEEAKKLIGEK